MARVIYWAPMLAQLGCTGDGRFLPTPPAPSLTWCQQSYTTYYLLLTNLVPVELHG